MSSNLSGTNGVMSNFIPTTLVGDVSPNKKYVMLNDSSVTRRESLGGGSSEYEDDRVAVSTKAAKLSLFGKKKG